MREIGTAARARRRCLGGALVGCVVLLAGGVALAERRAPVARTGFQLALRSGFIVRAGELMRDVAIGDEMGVTFPLQVDLGWKVSPRVFVGGFVMAGVGLAGKRMRDQCQLIGGTCLSFAGAIGPQVQVHLWPHRSVNPWGGFGVGLSLISSAAYTERGDDERLGVGLDFARLAAGVDFRVDRRIGLGPYVGLTGGTTLYTHQITPYEESSGGVDRPSVHVTFSLGIRVLFFP